MASSKLARRFSAQRATRIRNLQPVEQLQDARAEAVYWERAEPTHPAEVRALALQGLGTLGAVPGKDKLGRLLACAAEVDFRGKAA